MSILYPGTPEAPAFDTFHVPTLPEDTPLSQAGPGNDRNLTESIDDLGDAVEQLERGASYRDHDHSGDGTHIRKGSKLKAVNTHEDVLVDAPGAIHRTVGPGAQQAAAGNHTHDYNGDSILNVPFKICTSTTRPGSPVEGMVIYERDTKAFRQWALFANNVVVDGLNVLYEFDTASTLTVGGGGWTVGYSLNDTKGKMVTPAGSLVWIDAGNERNRAWARRTGSDPVTQTDDQVFTWKTGNTTIEETLLFTESASNDWYFRVSADEQSYLRLIVGNDWVALNWTTTGRAGEKELGRLGNINTDVPNTEWRAQMAGRDFQIFRAGELLGTIKDTNGVTAKGANFRGYMIGMEAGVRGFGQTTPGEILWWRVQDLRYYASTNRWTLLPLGATPVTRLRQSKTQKLYSTGTILEFAEELEDNFGYFDKNVNQSNITIKEPGMYRVEAALQWDPQFAPDQAHVVVLVNGVETTVRDSKFIRGSGFTPGFSQTLSLAAPIRLAANDVVSIKAFYTAGGSWLDKIFSFWDQNSKVNSRLDLTYTGP
ncbi:hypothetical protein KHO57_gp214 [Mycobacterium phage Phabba]|uniref:DUF7257 domain-containing protein n=1 Tax=Mycobacterium phage Phabba TaxID=2027899 RepID=A0A249XSR0_9CAUD|nr:hypothetical protein KHO57_gp214 [Mycobacterium phage Phabba]ASZ74690.1 hypothetical protein SEA_PHABBA_121 [Mycobacterium phage Phabba]